jgi:hypothetical protein
MKYKLLLLTVLSAWFFSGQAEPPTNLQRFSKLATNQLSKEEIEILTFDGYPIARFVTENDETRFFVQTDDFVKIFAYSGTTNLGIIFSEKGEIVSIDIISSGDTRSYVRRLRRSGYLDQFIGFSGDQELTALTGATISSQAINKTVQQTVDRIQSFFVSSNDSIGD